MKNLRPACMTLLLFTLVTGVAYPLAVTGVARQGDLAFQHAVHMPRRFSLAIDGTSMPNRHDARRRAVATQIRRRNP